MSGLLFVTDGVDGHTPQSVVVGWLINHGTARYHVRFSGSFVRRDLARGGRSLPLTRPQSCDLPQSFAKMQFDYFPTFLVNGKFSPSPLRDRAPGRNGDFLLSDGQ